MNLDEFKTRFPIGTKYLVKNTEEEATLVRYAFDDDNIKSKALAMMQPLIVDINGDEHLLSITDIKQINND